MDYQKSDIPEFKCHKKVKAFNIIDINIANGVITLTARPGGYSIIVTEEYFNKHNPQPGGYYVLYENGYESYSPAKAFEEGYSLDENT